MDNNTKCINGSPGTKSLSNGSGHNCELPILDPLLSRVVLTPRNRKSLNETNYKYQSFQNNALSDGGTSDNLQILTPNKLKRHQNNLFTKNTNQELHNQNQSPGKVSVGSSVVTRASSSDDHYNNSTTGSMELLWDAECLELSQNQSTDVPEALSIQDHSFNDLFVTPFNHHPTPTSSAAHYNGLHHLTHEQVPIQNESSWITSPRHHHHPPPLSPRYQTSFNHSSFPSSALPTVARDVSGTMSGNNISCISGNMSNSDSSFSHPLSSFPSHNRNNVLNETGSNIPDHDDLEWDNYDCDFIDKDDGDALERTDGRERY